MNVYDKVEEVLTALDDVATAIGALAVTALLAHTSINRRVGMRMFQAVIVFGLEHV